MDVVKDETFGPVLAIVRVDGAAEAIRPINAGRYGLTASIWSKDVARAVGVVTINNHAFTGGMPSLPWSGTRDTGTGIADGVASLGTITRPRHGAHRRQHRPRALLDATRPQALGVDRA